MTTNTTMNSTAPSSELRLTVTVSEAATMLGIGRTLAYEMARDGRLPTVALSARRYVVPRKAVDEMLTAVGVD